MTASRLCLCGCGREGDIKLLGRVLGRADGWPPDLAGGYGRSECIGSGQPNYDAFAEKARARRAALANGVEPARSIIDAARETALAAVTWAPSIRPDAEMYVLPKSEPIAPGEYDQPAAAPAICAGCSSPATHGAWCAYCCNTEIYDIDPGTAGSTDSRVLSVAARARMALMDRREAKPITATDRELAKAHPWACGGEDEP